MSDYNNFADTDNETPYFEQLLKTALDNELLHTWTALPGVVKTFHSGNQTAEIEAAILQEYTDPASGKILKRRHPVLPNVPVHFTRGGGFSLTHPLNSGDSGLIIFAARCIDSWYQYGNIQPQAVRRRHDFSDAIFVPGINSIKDALSGFDNNGIQLRNDEGNSTITVFSDSLEITKNNTTIKVVDNKIEMNVEGAQFTIANAAGKIELQAVSGVVEIVANEIELKAPTTKVTGNLELSGGISTAGGGPVQIEGDIAVDGNVLTNGINLTTHYHYVPPPVDQNTTGPRN